ncbi:MAG: Zn-ribbon domain-containing OB-fold protein [Desulfomonilaceae bacterium]|nr:Zn-ribbon domain-containing OB-fold protein [Desulfomonilaceae bacterium]
MGSYPLTFHEFKQGLAEGELPGLKCEECGEGIVPPSAVCTACGSTRLSRTSFAGKGSIRTFTVIRVGPEGFTPPYIVALVELDEGPWVLGNLVGVDAASAGMDLMNKKVIVGSKVLPLKPSESGVEGVVLTFELT